MRKHHKAAKTATTKKESLTPSTSAAQPGALVKAASSQTTIADQNDALSPTEETLLAECESDIAKNLQGVFVFGHRLEQIREQRLYRQTHSTFEAYCKEKWDFSKTHANRLIQAHICQKHLKAVKDIEVNVPTKESQVRFIADLKPEQQVEVAQAVFEKVGDKGASAEDFADARQELYPKPERKTVAPKAPKVVEDVQAGHQCASLTFDTNLVPFTEIKVKLQELYYIFCNSARKQEGLNLISKLHKYLDQWVDWQANQNNGKEVV